MLQKSGNKEYMKVLIMDKCVIFITKEIMTEKWCGDY